jgi:hypothetical protein
MDIVFGINKFLFNHFTKGVPKISGAPLFLNKLGFVKIVYIRYYSYLFRWIENNT